MAVCASKIPAMVNVQSFLTMNNNINRVAVMIKNGASATIVNSFLLATNLSANAIK